jgi:hypothetical protein
MAVWESYRGGELEEKDGPVVPETSPFRPRPRRTPVPIIDEDTVPARPMTLSASESAGDADRV